jgi:hypothetical protein
VGQAKCASSNSEEITFSSRLDEGGAKMAYIRGGNIPPAGTIWADRIQNTTSLDAGILPTTAIGAAAGINQARRILLAGVGACYATTSRNAAEHTCDRKDSERLGMVGNARREQGRDDKPMASSISRQPYGGMSK